MKKVKRLTAVLMIGAMTLALVACGGKQEAVSTTAAPAPTQAESAKEETKAEGKETQAEAADTEKKDSYTFGYIAYDMTDIWNEYASKAFEYAASQADVEVKTIVLDSKNSLEESVTAMESLIQQEVDGISIFPISTEQGAQLVKMANEAGIPVTVENFAIRAIILLLWPVNMIRSVMRPSSILQRTSREQKCSSVRDSRERVSMRNIRRV